MFHYVNLFLVVFNFVYFYIGVGLMTIGPYYFLLFLAHLPPIFLVLGSQVAIIAGIVFVITSVLALIVIAGFALVLVLLFATFGGFFLAIFSPLLLVGAGGGYTGYLVIDWAIKVS